MSALFVMGTLALVSGALLGFAAIRFRVASDSIVDQIDDLLPQTQCGQCSYPGCRPYAQAIAHGIADINQCPPGGGKTIQALASLLGRDVKPLNPAHGQEKPSAVAVIDEEVCIGCRLCIEACPVDAILGASKQMHTVISGLCTGCDLCVAPCPVDCIEMVQKPLTVATWKWPHPPLRDARPTGPASTLSGP